MLTKQTKRSSLLAVVAVTLLMTLTSGTMTVQAQDGITLTPGQGASPQDALLAEALGAMVQAGFNPADFDLEQAVFDPRGRAVFLPVRATEEVNRQAQEFMQGEQRFLLIGMLYARQPFEFQGKRYGRGIHPIVLENPAAQESPLGKSSNTGPALYDGSNDSCVINCIYINAMTALLETSPKYTIRHLMEVILIQMMSSVLVPYALSGARS